MSKGKISYLVCYLFVQDGGQYIPGESVIEVEKPLSPRDIPAVKQGIVRELIEKGPWKAIPILGITSIFRFQEEL